LVLALASTDRPWPPKGIGSQTIDAIGIAMIGSEGRGFSPRCWQIASTPQTSVSPGAVRNSYSRRCVIEGVIGCLPRPSRRPCYRAGARASWLCEATCRQPNTLSIWSILPHRRRCWRPWPAEYAARRRIGARTRWSSWID
jgi:hypothetical protein